MGDFRRTNSVERLKDFMQPRQMYNKLEVNIINLKYLNVETCISPYIFTENTA